MMIFNNTSADFVMISVENYHNFEQNEDRATVILKWTDFIIETGFNFLLFTKVGSVLWFPTIVK